MKYWSKPTSWWQHVLHWIGFVAFWLLLPVWLLCSWFWWKGDSAFVLIHLQAIFYNPWDLN